MGILGQHITGLAENIRPAFGFSKSITSPKRVPFQLLRESDENEGHDGSNLQSQKNTTELEIMGKNEEGQKTARKYGRPGQVAFHSAKKQKRVNSDCGKSFCRFADHKLTTKGTAVEQ